MRIGLGTVQFGVDYGIANTSGQVSFGEAKKIVEMAARGGIEILDTAIGYGESESVLGRIGVSDQKVISKLPSLGDHAGDIAPFIVSEVDASLSRLNISELDAVLLHRSEDLAGAESDAVFAALDNLKSSGRAKKIGISIYDPDELETCRFLPQLDLVQAPFNILDQRLRTSGWLQTLKSNGVEIHTRSVFLQGLLVMEPTNRPPWFQKFHHHLDPLDTWIADKEVPRSLAALSAVLAIPEIDCTLVGVDTADQLAQIIEDAGRLPLPTELPNLSCMDLDLIDPRNWKT